MIIVKLLELFFLNIMLICFIVLNDGVFLGFSDIDCFWLIVFSDGINMVIMM